VKILLVQAKPKTGDLEYNFNLIREAYSLAKSCQLDLCIFPELVSTGYMCEDLFLKPSFILALEGKIAELIKTIERTALILPTPYLEDGKLFNAVISIQNHKIIGKSFKKHLPNYGIYDEKRYFIPIAIISAVY
jgi:NAD+ synthase